MKANEPENMPELLAGWLIQLISDQRVLTDWAALQSFFAYIAEEDIEQLNELVELFEAWREEYGR